MRVLADSKAANKPLLIWVVRERAAGALSGFRSEPVVQEWLEYLAENDADQRVRREAFQSLGD